MDKPPTSRIYLIGGLPRTGKSTLAARLHNECDTRQVDTDMIRTMFNGNPRSKIGYGAAANIKAVTAEFRPYLHALIEGHPADEDILIEGEIVGPKSAAKLQRKYPISSCFLGLNDPEATYDRIREVNDPSDWAAQWEKGPLMRLLAKYAVRSAVLEAACAKHDLAYFDASSDYESVQRRAYAHLIGSTLEIDDFPLANHVGPMYQEAGTTIGA